jgi:hypothetical protein
MDAEFFTQEDDAVAGLTHAPRDFPAHLPGSAFYLCEGTSGGLGRV